ncbi:MAG: C10 family peptidase [Bacteroidia bacterium]|nr:C10 family peptidase [Bacteroidia bacterium]
MRTFIYMFFIILFAMPTFAKNVDVETAKSAAKNLYYLKVSQLKDIKLAELNLSLAYTEVVNSEPVYYVFNVNSTEGFVVISANDIAMPCIGYSFEGAFPTNNLPPTFSYYMGAFRDQIASAISQKAAASAEATAEWTRLLANNPTPVKTLSTMPLLIHTWNQDWPYNELCPADAAGPGGHVYVGCVATSMIQCMKYYNYPTTGTGTHTNSTITNGGYGNQTVNYANQTYVWENMQNVLGTSSSSSTLEVAKIGFHASVSVNMNYGADGSGSQTSSIPAALESHFKYSTDCQYVQKTSYTQTNWENMLKTQIDSKWPMVYQGLESAASAGHAWNCDGYITGTTNEFHMNWGWGGSANGYFSVAGAINSGGGYTFDTNFGAVINIYPSANYPTWCSGTKTITGTAGTFNDGSGNQNYLDNQDCLYLIQPACGSFVTLLFDRFDLGTGDLVKVYDGATTSDPLLATYDAANLPASSITSTSGNMLLEFITDGSNNATGWYASYSSFPCTGSKTLTTPSGTISDGSNSCDYKASLICTWNIQPSPAAASISLTFPDFNFAAGDAGDALKVYKNTTGTLIGSYNALNLPPASLDIVASKVILRFQTNSTNQGAGWTVNYNSTLTGIENNLAEFSTGIFPNPFTNDATISYTLTDVTDVKISVTNVLGEVIGNYNKFETAGSYSLPLSSFTEQISQGMYFVNFSFNDKLTTVKIVCTK